MPEESGLENMSMHENLSPVAETPMEIKPIAGGSQENDNQKQPSPEEKIKSLLEVPSGGGEAEITSKKLLNLASLLIEPQSRERLEELKKKGEDWFLDELVPEDQWVKLAPVMEEMISSKVSPGEKGPVLETVGKTEGKNEVLWTLPEDPAEQREKVIAALEEIESNNEPLSSPDNALATKLRSSLEKMEPRLKAECQARLRLQECYAYFSLIGGSEEATKSLRAAIEAVIRKGNVLVGRDFEVLLKEGLPNLRIADAFKKLEDFAVNGRTWGGKDTVVHFRQSKDVLPDQLLIMEEIKNELGGDRFAAKSLQLATRLATVTFETSVWNKELAGSDPLAEAIYLRDYRQGRSPTGQDRGPEITISAIDGFGTSFFRSAQLSKDGFIGAETKKERESKGLDMSLIPREKFSEDKPIKEQQDRTCFYNRIENGKTVLLNFSSMELAKLDAGAYGRYLSSSIPKFLQVKDLLLRDDFKPEDFQSGKIHGWITPFKAADPDEIFGLKVFFVLGAIDTSLNDGESLGWGQRELAGVRNKLITPLGKDDEGKTVYFIAPNQQRWIWKKINAGWRAAKVDAALSIRGVARIRR